MRKLLLTAAAACLAVCALSADARATANYVYHEQTANFVATPTCPSGGTDASCGRYVENTDRAASPGFQIYSPEAYSLHFKIEYQFYTNQARVYYTTDGSTPSGSFGTPFGTTQVATAPYTCTYSDQTQGCQIVDVLTGSIPAQPPGTTVKYIIGAWHSGGGPEVFANSGGCNDSTTGCATVFQYNVLAVPATPLVISEFRLRGPGPSPTPTGVQGANDEFIEIYNNSDSPVTVNAFDGSAGFAVAASDFVTRFTIPNGTVIPARGHYLGVNSVGYSLGAYPASTRPAEGGDAAAGARGAPAFATSPALSPRLRKSLAAATAQKGSARPRTGGGLNATESDPTPGPSATATGDAVYATDIADNAGVALFNTANPANFNFTTRLDAVGSTSEANTLFKEGAGYPALGGTTYFNGLQHSFYRDMCGKGGSTSALGVCSRVTPQDTEDNAADFIFVDTNGMNVGAGQRLGAPGPENSTSPIQRNAQMPGSRIFPCVSSAAPPNRSRNLTSDPANNSTFGTLTFRTRVTNATGSNVTRLRFRIIDISTFPAPVGTADLRARTSSLAAVPDPCNAGLPVLVQGTTLEEPPAQPNGGAFNSTLSAGTVTLATPIGPGETYDFQLLLGVQQVGRFKFYLNVEVLP